MVAGVADALRLLRYALPLTSRDFAADPLDALLYALLVGWSCEECTDGPCCDDPDLCGADTAFHEVADRYGWDATRVQLQRDARRRGRPDRDAPMSATTGRVLAAGPRDALCSPAAGAGSPLAPTAPLAGRLPRHRHRRHPHPLRQPRAGPGRRRGHLARLRPPAREAPRRQPDHHLDAPDERDMPYVGSVELAE